MLNSHNKFIKLIDDTKTVKTLYTHIKDTIVAPIDISDLLRWQWVQCVSALDKLIHDLVRIGMVEIYLGKRVPTSKFNSFTFDIKTFQEMNGNQMEAAKIFEQKVILSNGYQSFQEPSKIAGALSYIWNEDHKWFVISKQMGIKKDLCETTLKNIVIRRNQIVHEGDYTDSYSRQDILEKDVDEVRDFILELGQSIYECVNC